MSPSARFALTLAGFLSIAGCQTHPAQDSATKSPAGERPAAPPAVSTPAAPNPVPFRPVPPEPTPTPSTTAPTPAPSQPKPPSSVTKAPPKTTAPTAVSPPKPTSTAPPSTAPATTAPAAEPGAPKPASLDLNSLEQRLKDTHAIGVFTKLSLKNQVDDLLSELREFHKGSANIAQPLLRQKYDLLIMKVLSLLQNGDPPLASAIASSREAIWQILMDPSKFAKI
jgi:hypothetical protein